MPEFDDMTDDELKNAEWEIEQEVIGITEQIEGVYQLNLNNTPETRDWLFRALAARRYRRVELKALRDEIAARKTAKNGGKQDRRDRHIGMLVNARFVKTARQFLTPAQFDKIMDRAKADASGVLDENGAPVQAA